MIVAGHTIVGLSRLPLADLAIWLERLWDTVSSEEWVITEPIIDDLHERVRHLIDVVRAYLTMDRASPTLSADWIIDLEPGGGDAGGRIIAKGTPEQIAQEPASYTG